MKAVIVEAPYGLNNVRVIDRPEPRSPGPGQILVRVGAGSLNRRDVMVATGFDKWRPPSGRILGSDVAGEIIALGADVSDYALGDRVTSSFLPSWLGGTLTREKLAGSYGGAMREGLFAEYVLLDAASIVRVPAGLSDAEASTLVCAGVTAWHALRTADSLHPGRTVLIQGTGGVSMFALGIAATAGARVIATSSSDAKLDRARALGAAVGINYGTIPNWAAEAVRLTDGVGVEHVVDIGGASTLPQSIVAAACDGTVSLIGLIGGQDVVVNVSDINLRNIRLQGIETGSRGMLAELGQWVEQTNFRPVVGATYPFVDAGAALERLSRSDVVGKICLEF